MKNENQGALFKAEKKTDKSPEYTGSCVVNGQHYWISSWLNKDKNGNTYMSLKFKSKDEGFKEAKEAVQAAPKDEFESEIPF